MGVNTIRIKVKSSPQAFLLKDQLLADGLVWRDDFTWKYNPANTNYDYENNIPASVEFTFTDAKLATYYRLKWTET